MPQVHCLNLGNADPIRDLGGAHEVFYVDSAAHSDLSGVASGHMQH